MPAAPTLTIADNADGTGAVATVAGADGGTTNEVYTQAVNGELGTTTWTSGGSRSGNGTVALALAKGYYWAYCKSTLAGSDAISTFVYFNVTDAEQAYLYQIFTGVQARIQALSLEDIADTSIVIRKLPLDRNLVTLPQAKSIFHSVTLPAIMITPSVEQFNLREGTNLREDIRYSVLITIVDVDNQEPTLIADLPKYLKWREQIRRALVNQYLPGITNGAMCDQYVPQELPSLQAWKMNYWAMAQLARFKSRETRGLT